MAGADAVARQPWQAMPSDQRSKLYRLNLGPKPAVSFSGLLAPVEVSTGVAIHGPEIGFARTLQTRMPGNYIFVKATGNIPPSERDFLWSVDKTYMREALSFFAAVCGLEIVRPSPAAILMAQGIDEALSERYAEYRSALFGLIGDLRGYFHNPALPFIIGKSVNSPYADASRMADIREAQQQASLELPRVRIVSADDLTPYIRKHHLSSVAQLEFGRRFAMAFLSL